MTRNETINETFRVWILAGESAGWAVAEDDEGGSEGV